RCPLLRPAQRCTDRRGHTVCPIALRWPETHPAASGLDRSSPAPAQRCCSARQRCHSSSRTPCSLPATHSASRRALSFALRSAAPHGPWSPPCAPPPAAPAARRAATARTALRRLRHGDLPLLLYWLQGRQSLTRLLPDR